MTGIIVTGGNAPAFSDIEEYLLKGDYIIAADSGLDTLEGYGYKADMVMGDMDSLQDSTLLSELPPEKIMKFPMDKDFTDTELALNFLNEKGYEDIYLIGGGGGRLDHIIALYSLFFRELSPLLWVTQKEKIFLVKENISVNINKNSIVSFFPVGKKNCKMISRGLKWELNGLNWEIGDSGISNRALEKTIDINMLSGKLLMIIPIGENY